MVQTVNVFPPRLSEDRLEALCRQVCDAAEFMSDDQILCLADSLHDTLRDRRQRRGRVHQRMEQRLCSQGGPLFPS